jgi:hypothetical protein
MLTTTYWMEIETGLWLAIIGRPRAVNRSDRRALAGDDQAA